MPEGMGLHEQAAYQALRHLYVVYRQGWVSREEASVEKRKIYAAYEKEKKGFAQAREICLTHAAMWKQIEAAANRYGRERTLEHADAFVRAVYGAGCKRREEPREE